jgi:hypothetical protein
LDRPYSIGDIVPPHGDDLLPALAGQQQRLNERAERPHAFARPSQPACMKPLLPAPHAGFRFAGPTHDLVGTDTVGTQQDDLSPPDVLMRRITIPRERSQAAAVSGLESAASSSKRGISAARAALRASRAGLRRSAVRSKAPKEARGARLPQAMHGAYEKTCAALGLRQDRANEIPVIKIAVQTEREPDRLGEKRGLITLARVLHAGV